MKKTTLTRTGKTIARVAGGALALSMAFGTSQVMADNCYIMVHGHGEKGYIKDGTNQPALDYWSDYAFDNYKGASFLETLLGPNDNYGIVGYDSTDESEYPYWHDKTSGEIARQIISIRQGNGDGFVHPESGTQCSSSDDFWVVSHSQGAPQMMYIAGNAVAGSPYYNQTFNQMDVGSGFNASNAVNVNFDAAISGILGIFTLGGALTGTEGADRVCDGNWLDDIINAAFLGKTCAGVRYMQTNDVYTVRNHIGTNTAAPFYTMGGYKSFPGAAGATAGFLTGEDDGYINLASQMSCEGSGKRSLWDDLKQYKTFFGIAYGSPIFTCNNGNKGTPRTYNMASIYTDHDAERNAGISSPSYTNIPDGISCGNGKNMAGRIKACLN